MAGAPPRRNKHLFTAPAIGLVASGVGLIMGVHGVFEVRNNPAPTEHPCREGLVAELGTGSWVDVSACEPDVENSVMVVGGNGSEAFYVALRDPESGEQAGVLRVDDPTVLGALEAVDLDPDGSVDDETMAALGLLFATPRTGMTARVFSDERKLLTRGLRGFGEDDPVIELGEAPHPTRSWVLIIFGAVGLAASGWGVFRAKRLKAQEDARVARWHAAGNSHNNPFLR